MPSPAVSEFVALMSPFEHLPLLQGTQVLRIACGGHHTLAITVDGKCYGWGCVDVKQVHPEPLILVPVDVTVDDFSIVVLKKYCTPFTAVHTSPYPVHSFIHDHPCFNIPSAYCTTRPRIRLS